MRSIKITEDNGLYVGELSSGVRASGASLETMLDKLQPGNPRTSPDYPSYAGIRTIFDAIPSANTGQFREGVASA